MSYTKLTVLAGVGTSPLFEAAPEPFGVIANHAGDVFFGDVTNHRIFRIDSRRGSVEAIVGNGKPGNDGDGGPALHARITQPYELRFDRRGNLYFVDMLAHTVRRIDAGSGLISTVAGNGEAGFSGDGGPAVAAQLNRPHSIELDGDGALYIADIANHRVRKVDLATGLIETFAGTGTQAATAAGASLTGNPLNGPRAVAFEANGNMILGLREGNAIYRVDMSTLVITHLAGTGDHGYSGDGGNARQARLAGPKGIAIGADGGIVIADTESHTIRRIGTDGSIDTLAGNGEPGDSTDPRAASLNRPHGVFVEASGAILVGDSDNRRLLRLE